MLEKARVIPDIDAVVITCPEAHLEETRKLIANHGFDEARFTCIVGGGSRQESVYLGLGALADVDSVIIHEAVRPLVTVAEFRELIAAAGSERDVRHPDPVHRAQGPRLRRGPPRARRAGQRPAAPEVRPGEAVSRRTRRPAARAPRSPRTPASSTTTSASRCGSCPASERNIKITVPTDIVTAEAIYADVHGPRGLTVGKVCVITGASQGIGRAAAIRMSREPDVSTLVLIARNADGLAETGAALDREGTQVELIPYDLMDLDGIPELVERIHGAYGSIDILLNIAGYADPQSLLDTDVDNIVKTYTINVFAMLLMSRETVRHMYDRPAKILNVASTAGITSRPGWLAYASSKAAVVSLSATLADELAGSGIKVYSISPGRTATELRRKLAPEEDPSSIMQPGDVADVIAQLMSDAEKTLDGQNIVVRTRA